MILLSSILLAAAGAPLPSPLSPDEALRAFEPAPGLRVELVAAEPLVASPCALAFDAKGRLFVAENRGYPIGPKEGDKPAGVIALLEDTDGDGRMDKRTVFADGLTFPNGVLPWKDGLIVTCAPDVLFLRDGDGDGVADERRVLLTGFATTGSTQLRVNDPTLGPDGWIYLAAGLSGGTVSAPAHPERPAVKMTADVRFHPETLVVEPVDGRSQFGLSFDAAGNRFICMNRLPVQHVVFDSRWLKRNPRLAFAETVQDCNERNAFNGINGGHDGVKLFPISSNITTADGHAGSFSAACAVTVWQGGAQMPAEFAGAVLSCDPTGNLVHADRLEARGATFSARPFFADREFLASRDDWFRPVFLTKGPEGALYVADMYRKVIEHPDYLSEEVRKHTDFETGKSLGRIWRVRSSQESGARAKLAHGELSADTPRRLFLKVIALGDQTEVPDATHQLAIAALRHSEDKWMRYAVLSGVHRREKTVLSTMLVNRGREDKVGAGLAEIIGHLAGALAGPGDLTEFADQPLPVRLAVLDGFLSEKGRRLDGLPAAFRSLLDAAPATAADPAKSGEERLIAVKLMARLPWESAGDSLLRLALDESVHELSAAALKAVAAHPRAEVSSSLIAGWPRYTPSRRDAILGTLLGSIFHQKALLGAVEDKRLPASSFAGVRRRQLLASKDPAIKALAERLLTVSARPEAMAEASKALELTPVPSAGRASFQALCATCHRLDREGHAVGPDLFDIRRQTKQNILFHIVNPDAEIAPAFTAYLAEAKDGRVLSGILVGDTPTSVTLRGPLGVEASLLRSELAKLEALPSSLMPTGLEAGLNKQQLADLLAYLKGEK
ncbi:MAG: PVC-type heme-binding CxxCH protein [Opitutia bacterium]